MSSSQECLEGLGGKNELALGQTFLCREFWFPTSRDASCLAPPAGDWEPEGQLEGRGAQSPTLQGLKADGPLPRGNRRRDDQMSREEGSERPVFYTLAWLVAPRRPHRDPEGGRRLTAVGPCPSSWCLQCTSSGEESTNGAPSSSLAQSVTFSVRDQQRRPHAVSLGEKKLEAHWQGRSRQCCRMGSWFTCGRVSAG